MRQFKVSLGSLDLAVVSYDGFLWKFHYIQDYHKIFQFPEFRDYESHELWQMFKTRIPPVYRPDVAKTIKDLKIDPKDEYSLLISLGSYVIHSPYTLHTISERGEQVDHSTQSPLSDH